MEGFRDSIFWKTYNGFTKNTTDTQCHEEGIFFWSKVYPILDLLPAHTLPAKYSRKSCVLQLTTFPILIFVNIRVSKLIFPHHAFNRFVGLAAVFSIFFLVVFHFDFSICREVD